MCTIIMGFRKNLRNRVGNTVGVVPRSTVGTGLYTVSDVTKTAIYGVLNPIEGIGKTASNIKEAVHNAFTNGKWYHKLRRAPASLIASPFMAVEGVAETLWGTSCNIFRNARDTIAHPFINVGHSIKGMGLEQNIGDFRFTKIDNRSEVNPRNRLAGLFGAKIEVDDTEKKLLKSREKHIKEQEAKLKKDMESRKNYKKNKDDEFKKQREDRRNDRKNKQDEYLQSMKKERDSFNKEKEELNKRISYLEKEKKDLELTLKNSNKKADATKTTQKADKKENINENNEVPTQKENHEEKQAA